MKSKLILIIAAFFCCTVLSQAQPKAAYIIPDIAAPGMNVYMEIVANYDANGTFGPDKTYLGNPSDNLKIELVNPAQSDSVTFGPLNVSWDGRLISTQVFVNPNVKPNSWDWQALNASYIVDFKINYNGQLSSPLRMYLVLPQKLGDISSNTERVLGAGSLGKRSPRGAMIVDSLVLANATYTVSKSDCDPNTAGNQGYLPFVLLSLRKITGGTNTFIDVSGLEKNAGPGGGGGGGRFYDAGVFSGSKNEGEDGGNGYTGGGAGGRNKNGMPTSSNVVLNPGFGSGDNPSRGYSLNGNKPSFTPNVWESAGGGTGHPFGSSGTACFDGNNCTPAGEFGGGSGVKQNTAGGAGGYGFTGQGPNGSGGQINGNNMSVPLAGGSGGASGNPQSGDDRSGNGGGGGGAIVVFSEEVYNCGVLANGGNGQGGNDKSDGGAGSGGFIGAYAKLKYDNNGAATLSVAGGKNDQNLKGGGGRLRYDNPASNITPINTDFTFFRGPSTDTTKYFKRKKFTVNGSKNGNDSISIYLKRNKDDWAFYAGIPSGLQAWSIDITPTMQDSLIYLVVGQSVKNPSSSQYLYEPSMVFSQAAANLMRIDKTPHLFADSVVVDSLINCVGNIKRESVEISNIGEADLILDLPNAKFLHNRLSLVTKLATTVKPGNNTSVEVEFVVPPNWNQTVYDTLVIPHNDFWGRKNPWLIAYEFKPIKIKPRLYEIVENQYKTLPADKTIRRTICSEDSLRLLFALENDNENSSELELIFTSDINLYNASILGKKQLLPRDTTTFDVVFKKNSAVGTFNTAIYVKMKDCDYPLDTLYAEVTVNQAKLQFVDNGTFPDTKVGKSATKVIRMKNTGNAETQIGNISGLTNGYSIVDINPVLPVILKPNEEIAFTVKFAPQFESTSITSSLQVSSIPTDTTCEAFTDLTLEGKGIASQVYVSKYLITYDSMFTCQSQLDSVFVGNPAKSTASFRIIAPPELTGADANAFEVTVQPNIPIVLNPGDSVLYVIKYKGVVTGLHTAQMMISTDDSNDDSVFVDLIGYAESTNIRTPTPVLPKVAKGFKVKAKYTIYNDGKLPVTLVNAWSDYPGLIINPTSGIIKPNESMEFDYEFVADGNPSLLFNFEFIECSTQIKVTSPLDYLKSSYSAAPDLNFGTLSACRDSIMTSKLINTGEAPLIYQNAKIIGNDAQYFTLEKVYFHNANDTIVAGDSVLFDVKFKPTNATDGIKSAQIQIECYIEGAIKNLTVNLQGDKQSGIIVTPQIVDFGQVALNKSAKKALSIKNIGGLSVKLISHRFASNGANGFSIETNPDGTVLVNNQELIDSVIFVYPNQASLTDTLFVEVEYQSCTEIIPIVLKANAYKIGRIVLKLPTFDNIHPALESLPIPIMAKYYGESTDHNLNFDTIGIVFNREVYYPLGVSGGNFIKDSVTLTERIFTFSIPQFSLSGLDSNNWKQIAVIEGAPMLGNTDYSSLQFTSISATDLFDKVKFDAIDTVSGYLQVETCGPGRKRLLEHKKPVFIYVSPNPASNVAHITTNVIETGLHKIELVSSAGNVIPLISWDRKIDDLNTFNYDVNLILISSGTYFLRLTTPTMVKTVQLIIVK